MGHETQALRGGPPPDRRQPRQGRTMQDLPTQEGTATDAPVPGTFVPFNNPPRAGKRSAKVGWIVADNGCHIWQGARKEWGYGQVWIDGRWCLVYRVRYEREVGPIPDGMELDHFACDNPSCCNPAHVRPVSHRENSLRGNSMAARNAAKTHCPQGHPHGPRTGWRQCGICQRDRQRRVRAQAAVVQCQR